MITGNDNQVLLRWIDFLGGNFCAISVENSFVCTGVFFYLGGQNGEFSVVFACTNRFI